MTPQSAVSKYPRIRVRVGHEDSPVDVVGRVMRAMGHHSVSREDIARFRIEASANDYKDYLGVVRRWVEVRR